MLLLLALLLLLVPDVREERIEEAELFSRTMVGFIWTDGSSGFPIPLLSVESEVWSEWDEEATVIADEDVKSVGPGAVGDVGAVDMDGTRSLSLFFCPSSALACADGVGMDQDDSLVRMLT